MEECLSCNGTGISPSGRVDDPCPHCGGTGVERTIDDVLIDDDPFMDWDDDIDY